MKFQKGLIIEKIDKEIVIFDSEKSVLYTLNETASFIFDKLKKKWDKEKIIDLMLKTYQVKKEKLEKDYDQLIADLKNKKILIV